MLLMNRLPFLLPLTLLTSLASAQLAVVIPNGTATAAGNSSNAFPWGTAATSWPGLRLMCIYDAANFTLQGISGPILVNRLRWRPNDGMAAFTGGTFTQADVRLSTAPMDYTSLTTNFTTNHGPDLTTVYSGSVVHQAGSGGAIGSVPAWTVDIQLTTPFLYDPNQGDLVIDCDYPGGANFVGGSLPSMDVQTTGSLSGRVWASSLYPNANGSALNHGVVVEVGYAPPAGFAQSVPFGTGCYDRASQAVYETFPNGTFDLSNTSIRLIPTGTGYVLVPGTNQWWNPVGGNLGLADDSVSAAQSLGFSLVYPGGSTSDVYISSNGFVWPQPSTINGCCAGDPGTLLTEGARWAPLWNDLNPAVGGSVVFDQDVPGGAAYVTFTGVPEFGTQNLNTFQVAFFANGEVEYRWQACSVQNRVALVGWAPNGPNRDPGSIDLSSSLPIITEPDSFGLAHASSSRPILGTSINLLATQVPAGATIGATLLGLGEFTAGLALDPFGMAGCFQYATADSTLIWLPTAAGGSTPFTIPNNPAFAGVTIRSQAAVLVAGVNLTGALTSNGLRLILGPN